MDCSFIHSAILRQLCLIWILTIGPCHTIPEALTYGKWTDALRFPESYENGIEPDGKKYFACQGQRMEAFDPIKDWWQQRCFDDIREEPRKPRVCNSTPACCYKFCVLQRLEWLTTDLKYDRVKAHAYVKSEFGEKKYPRDIIEDLIDEFDNCADWYEERDTDDCSVNSAFIKCQTQVFINVCDRLPTKMNALPAPTSEPAPAETSKKQETTTTTLPTTKTTTTPKTTASTTTRSLTTTTAPVPAKTTATTTVTTAHQTKPTSSTTKAPTVNPDPGQQGQGRAIVVKPKSVATSTGSAKPTACVDTCKKFCLAKTKF